VRADDLRQTTFKQHRARARPSVARCDKLKGPEIPDNMTSYHEFVSYKMK
jgi:hypothetical protein